MEIDLTCDCHTIRDGPLCASDVFLQHLPRFDDSYSPPYEAGVYSEPAPDEDPASSPLRPITPFGVFVDRAVAAAHFSGGPKVGLPIPAPFEPDFVQYGAPPPLTLQYAAAQQQPGVPLVPDVVPMPSATFSYKKVADPLAEWVATFVWNVCTTGMCLDTHHVHSYNFNILLFTSHHTQE
jgi:hypothetical protein